MDNVSGKTATLTLRMSEGLARKLEDYVNRNMAVYASTAVQAMVLSFLSAPESYPPITDRETAESLKGRQRTSFTISAESYGKLSEYAAGAKTTPVELVRRIMYYTLENRVGES